MNPVTEGNQQKYLDLFERNTRNVRGYRQSADSRGFGREAGLDRGEEDYEAAFDRLAGVWNSAAGIAQKAGIRLNWEFEPGFAFNKPSEILAMHAKVAHPNFRLMFDTSHAYMCAVVGARQHGARETLPGGVAELLKKLKGRIEKSPFADRLRRHAARRREQHAPGVRRRLYRFQGPCAAADGRAEYRLVVHRHVLLGRLVGAGGIEPGVRPRLNRSESRGVTPFRAQSS